MSARLGALCAGAAIGLLATRAIAASAGPVPGMTGAPGGFGIPAEDSCQSCHNSWPLNPDADGRVSLSGAPATYVPGQTYKLTLQVSHPAASRWGFELTAISKATFKGAGDLTPLPGDHTTQHKAGDYGRAYVEQGGPGRLATGIGVKPNFSWSFNWTAPATDVGDVAFYAAANMANGDNDKLGDRIYASHQPLAISKGTKHRP